MKKIINLHVLVFFLLFSHSMPQGHAGPTLMSLDGFWVYGFEQSIIETCDGKLYWMWTPSEFKGRYLSEGYRNPVEVSGYLLPANPENNMNSSLPELKVVDIKHTKNLC